MFFFNCCPANGIKEVSQNAIHVRNTFNEYPPEMEHNNDLFVYGTMHNGAAVYYRETWFRS